MIHVLVEVEKSIKNVVVKSNESLLLMLNKKNKHINDNMLMDEKGKKQREYYYI